MDRYLEPELLDHLDPDDPEAVQSRAELRLVNAIMGNHRWLLRQLRSQFAKCPTILELGAGDGAFGRSLVARGFCKPEQVIATDLVPTPLDWPAGARWIQGSIFDAESFPKADIIITNLFLHHFTESQLLTLGQSMRSARMVIACEPSRRRFNEIQGALLAAVADFGRVTCHDMMVSIRAGFAGDELPRALGLMDWKCRTTETWLGAYHLVAHSPCVSSP